MVGGDRDTDKCRIAAIGAAEDSESVRVGVALGDGPVGGIEEIVVHRTRELADSSRDMPSAVARRAPKVDLQHRITTVGQQLRLRVVSPGVVSPGPAVDQKDQRPVSWLDPDRRVRNACSGSPSRAGNLTASIGASAAVSRCGYGRNSCLLSPVA